jgi:uncharacterized protein (UPF0332 family)
MDVRNQCEALLQKAESKLKTAEIDCRSGQHDDAVSRAYYAVFHALSAALLKRGLVFSSHGQVIGAFNRELVKSGVFPLEFTTFVQALFDDRQAVDYDVESSVDEVTAREHIDHAVRILQAIRQDCALPS